MKGRPFYLSQEAQRSLLEIALWTEEHFGPAQADRYRDLLIARCLALAAGELPHRSCRVAIAPDLAEDLRFVSAGRHVVIFTETATALHVVDFLHGSADLKGRLLRGAT
jgi:plasmid stabilization system protein ParE